MQIRRQPLEKEKEKGHNNGGKSLRGLEIREYLPSPLHFGSVDFFATSTPWFNVCLLGFV